MKSRGGRKGWPVNLWDAGCLAKVMHQNRVSALKYRRLGRKAYGL
jgi:hypothetical protein